MTARAEPSGILPEHERVFSAWSEPQVALWSEGDGRTRKEGVLSPASADHYRKVWLAWCEWLAGRPMKRSRPGVARWRLATAEDVSAFLNEPPQAKTRATKVGKLASFSRRSYWNVLSGVYASAVKSGHITDSPLVQVPRPGVDKESLKPQFLDPAVLRRLQSAHSLKRLVPQTEPSWLAARDRAAIALVATCAPTAAELRALKVEDLRLPSRQRGLDGMQQPQDGQLDLPGRTLTVPADIVPLLRDWLAEREEVVSALRPPPGRPGVAPHRMALFIGREGHTAVGAAQEPPGLPAPTVHLIFARVIEGLYEKMRASGQLAANAYAAKGPASVRNSVIREWALKHDAATAATWAGLKRVSGRYL
ncbi:MULTISPECIES: hypothetical protein [Ramlibacter]|uniref:Integrase n=1 Tax=Ramlibacter aquaticus TaxID=2780094 RepID=A0ABR9SJ26_9BURK|nr:MULTISPECIES: hypothetical protein [Ramlibacter]MBE7942368.1 hypothetical protein [Ramlibacter aquaticus]